MRARFFCIGLVALLAECAVANAVPTTTAPEIEPFDLATNPKVVFTVTTGEGFPVPEVTNDNNGPISNSSPLLTFNKFNTSLGTLLGVSITLTSSYGATVTVSEVNDEAVGKDDFFADATIDHDLTGSLISPVSSQQTFSATCSPSQFGCTSGPVSNNNPAFGNTQTFSGIQVTPFNGPGTFDLTAKLTSALEPRDRDAVDNSTGTLEAANWVGNVSVFYTYEPFPPAQVPEPLSLYLVLAGLGGIALSRRRRR